VLLTIECTVTVIRAKAGVSFVANGKERGISVPHSTQMADSDMK